MATHSSVLAWRIPGTGEPGGLPSMGSHRVGHEWSDLAASVPHWASLVAQRLKHLPGNARDPGSIPGLGRSPGEGNSAPLQYSCLENPMDGGVWWAAAHRVTKSQTQLSGFTFFLSVPHWWTWSTTKIDHLRPKRQKIFYQWSSFFFWNKCILLFFSRFVEICDTQHCISLGCTALFDLHVSWNDYQS